MPKFVRYLCIAFVITVLAIPVAWFAVQRTEAFAVASTHAKNSTDIRSRLGEIQDVDLPFLGYSVHVAGASGDANFNLKLKGSLAAGTVFVELTRQGTWRPVASRLVLQDGTAIDVTR